MGNPKGICLGLEARGKLFLQIFLNQTVRNSFSVCTYSVLAATGMNSPWTSVRTPVDHLGTQVRPRGCQG